MKIKVNLKSIGKRRSTVQSYEYEIIGRPSSVRELILAVTERGVSDYNKKRESQELLCCLTKEEMEDRAVTGKISFGFHYGEKGAELEEARENAIQCFEDGIYRVFMDGRPLESLDETICITENQVFTFVRMTMLAGRMW